MHQYNFQYIFRLFEMKFIANVKLSYDHEIEENGAVALLL